jgi:acyl-CoA thioesterase I
MQNRMLLLLALAIFVVSCKRPSEPGQAPTNLEPAVTANLSGPINYVALGDSTGAGVGAREGGYVARLFRRIAAIRPGSTLTNLCVSGATAEDVLRRQLDQGISAKPNFVTLGIGINDVGLGIPVEEFAANYDSILTRLKTETNAAVLIVNIPDVSQAPAVPASLRAEHHASIVVFNQRIAEIALRHGVTALDIYSATRETLSSHPEFFSADGFHPSDKGYEVWAGRMWPAIAQLIGAEGS